MSENEAQRAQQFETLLQMAVHMDWMQVVLNGGSPCFHVEDGRFCARAERWDGHGYYSNDPQWPNHKFVSFAELLQAAYAAGAAAKNEACATKCEIALKLAHEWSAKFPLKGEASEEDAFAANKVYVITYEALKTIRAQQKQGR